jgi:hypothetical protein
MRRKLSILIAAIVIVSLALTLPVTATSICPFETPEGIPPELLPSPLEISSNWQVVGISSGAVSIDLSVAKENYGNLTAMELYSSSLQGRGGIQFESDYLLSGTKITGNQAAQMGGGMLVGSSSVYTFSATPHTNFSDPANETMAPICSHASTVSSYTILNQGTAASLSIVDIPGPGMSIAQQFAMEGSGAAGMLSKYNVVQGFDLESVDQMTGRAKTIGDGIQFAGSFAFGM